VLEDGPAYPDEIQEATGLARSTVRNTLGSLKKSGRVEPTGETRGQFEQVGLAGDLVTSLYKEKSPSHPGPDTVSGPPTTVAEFFANPPGWLPSLLEKYRETPERYWGSLCHTVAVAIREDGSLAGEDVAEEVERILEEGAQS